jgi:hypothetical protein
VNAQRISGSVLSRSETIYEKSLMTPRRRWVGPSLAFAQR